MVRVAADTYRSRMPLRPVRRRRDEIEDVFDGLAYLDAVANARHSQFLRPSPVTLRMSRSSRLLKNVTQPRLDAVSLLSDSFDGLRARPEFTEGMNGGELISLLIFRSC